MPYIMWSHSWNRQRAQVTNEENERTYNTPSGQLQVAYLLALPLRFDLPFFLVFFYFDSARVRPHKESGEPAYNAKVYSAYLSAATAQAIDAVHVASLVTLFRHLARPRPALLILLTWIFTSHKPIFGWGQAFSVAT